MRVCHTNDAPAVAAVFDFIFGFAACYLFYRLAVDFLPATWLVAVLFLAMIQFGMSWVVPWQRPEMLPTSLFLAVVLFSLARVRQSLVWVGLIVAATFVQGFIRTDVPLVLGVSIILLSVLPGDVGRIGTRRFLVSLGGIMVFVTGTIQGYLRYVRLPNLHHWPSN
jgi:hypothetical protein